jgi:hypothetical protein
MDASVYHDATTDMDVSTVNDASTNGNAVYRRRYGRGCVGY